jgi:type VI secretion system protein ImpJ
MFLTPHHFQQWDNYHEDTLNFRFNCLTAFGWGLADIQINREGLANGQFTLLRCSGLMPGGLAINIPESDDVPSPRAIGDHFAPSAESLDVHLAAPLKRTGSANVRLDGSEGPYPARFRSDLIRVADEITGENEREIAVARKNFRILFGNESVADHESIKIAVLKRTSTGAITLEDKYIPPSLRISASRYLTEVLLRLLEILHTKSSSLSEHRGQRIGSMSEFSTYDVTNFWRLHTVNSFIPRLDHYYRVGTSHPEQLFVTLAQLAGELISFSPTLQPKDLPKYNHTDLSGAFTRLDETIQELLKAGGEELAVLIPLTKESESKFTARIVDDQLLISSQILLAASAEIPEHQLIAEIPQQAKISSMDNIESLLGLALPGVALVHRPVPPAPLRVKLGYHYFRLETLGTPEIKYHWEAIRSSRTIAIRIPNPRRFAGLKLELWAIKE